MTSVIPSVYLAYSSFKCATAIIVQPAFRSNAVNVSVILCALFLLPDKITCFYQHLTKWLFFACNGYCPYMRRSTVYQICWNTILPLHASLYYIGNWLGLDYHIIAVSQSLLVANKCKKFCLWRLSKKDIFSNSSYTKCLIKTI